MLPADSRSFSDAFYVWLIGAIIAFVLFALGVKYPNLPYRGFAASVGGIACFVSMSAVTVIMRNDLAPNSMLGAISIYVAGIGFSAITSVFYTFFFTFWYAKNF